MGRVLTELRVQREQEKDSKAEAEAASANCWSGEQMARLVLSVERNREQRWAIKVHLMPVPDCDDLTWAWAVPYCETLEEFFEAHADQSVDLLDQRMQKFKHKEEFHGWLTLLREMQPLHFGEMMNLLEVVQRNDLSESEWIQLPFELRVRRGDSDHATPELTCEPREVVS